MQRTDTSSLQLKSVQVNALMPRFVKNGGEVLVTVVTQDAKTGIVLMVASVNTECFLETLRTGYAVYWSKSRKERWRKGDTSGNRQKVVDVLVNCDGSSVIYKVEQVGEGACHTNAFSCFYRRVAGCENVMEVPVPADKDHLDAFNIEVHASLLIPNP